MTLIVYWRPTHTNATAVPFAVLRKTPAIVAKNGNNVEATFDFVEKTIFYDKLVRHRCRFWQ